MAAVIGAQALRAFGERVYRAMGVPDAAAALVADTLVQADLWGHQSHGVMRLFWYGLRLESGAMKADATPGLDPQPLAISVLDGGDGIGQVMTRAAMEQAIAAARRHGIGAVAVRNSGHFGMAMYYTKMAADAGCIGFVSSNASPAMAPWGGMGKSVGNNPWSWAAPAGRHAPMVLDIANTAVARGKLYLARQRGETIPEGWAMDADGRITTDPAAGIAGTILPMAGHKGYAISMMMDVLSGVLTGSGFGPQIIGPYVPTGRSGVGHLVLAIDIAACRPLADFHADMEAMIAGLKATPCMPGVAEVFYPGEIEARNDLRQRADGIALPEATVADLVAEAEKRGIAHPF